MKLEVNILDILRPRGDAPRGTENPIQPEHVPGGEKSRFSEMLENQNAPVRDTIPEKTEQLPEKHLPENEKPALKENRDSVEKEKAAQKTPAKESDAANALTASGADKNSKPVESAGAQKSPGTSVEEDGSKSKRTHSENRSSIFTDTNAKKNTKASAGESLTMEATNRNKENGVKKAGAPKTLANETLAMANLLRQQISTEKNPSETRENHLTNHRLSKPVRLDLVKAGAPSDYHLKNEMQKNFMTRHATRNDQKVSRSEERTAKTVVADVSRETISVRSSEIPQTAVNQKEANRQSAAEAPQTIRTGTENRANRETVGFQLASFNGNAAKAAANQVNTGTGFSQALQSQFENVLTRSRVFIRDEGNARFTTQLYPMEMGRIGVKLALIDGALQGNFIVNSEQIQRELMSRMDNLLAQLRADGVNISRFSVDVQHEKAGEGRDSREDKRSTSGAGSSGDKIVMNTRVASPVAAGGTYA